MARLTALKPRLTQAKSRLRFAPKKADRFYTSPEWRGLMRLIKRQRGNYCQDCGAGGKGVRIVGDHVVEIKDGGAPLDEANVRLRCMKCHARKTAAVRAKRARGEV